MNLKDEKNTIRVSKKEYLSLMDRIKEIENGDKRSVMRRPSFRTARIRLFDEVPVIEYKKLIEKKIEDGQGGWKVELVLPFKLLTGEEKEEVYIDFLRNTSSVDCKILKMEVVDEGEKEFGVTKLVEYGEWNAKDTGIMVPNIVKTPVYMATIELPDGSQTKIMEEFLNV